MQEKPTYEELERSIKKLENEVVGRKRAEEALRETRDYLENLFNYANAPIIVWDTKAKITRFNHACEHLTGFTADEVIGQKLHILFPEASREESLSKIASTLSGEYWESVEIPTLHKTGDIRTALWNSANICAEDGTTVVATIAQGQDITERKRAEERIKHLNSVLRSIRNVNQLITREKNRERLIQRTCEELFETRGCHSAWIVLMDESHKVFTSAETGLGQKFSLISEGLERAQLTPCCKRAVTQEGVVTIEDPLSNCRDCPVSQMYEGSGALAMRLQHGGKIYGVLVISVLSDFVTDKQEHALFREVAGDIAFALHSIELEEQRKQAEEELR
ncbi:MAG: PAS domain S-box protein, partial [Proteobacteria bacterium]|nr:PAS domain S-box protein [Pseudomonadota bacterium]